MTTTLLRTPTVTPSQAIPCRSNPDYWTEAGNDPALKALCWGCPRRVQCAREALEMPGASGIWAGFYLPPDADGGWRPNPLRRHARPRAYGYAVTRLRVIAAMEAQQ